MEVRVVESDAAEKPRNMVCCFVWDESFFMTFCLQTDLIEMVFELR